MSETIGNLMFVLHSHLPYVLAHGKSPHGTDWLNEAAAESYLPLLSAIERLAEAGIQAKLTINISPILQEQLADEAFKHEFLGYLQEKIDASLVDQREFVAKGNLAQAGLAYFWQMFYSKRLEEFKDKYHHDILSGFRKYQESGHIEVITCAATHGYLALLGTDEAVQAQVKLGVQTYEKHFGRAPKGIWLPECAYRPAYEWTPPVGESHEPFWRKGVEEFLAENGIEFFFVDSHMLRGGSPIGTYAARFPALSQLYKRFSESYERMDQKQRSEYQSYLVGGSGQFHEPVTAFARDPETTLQVWSGSHGYPGDEHYLEFHKMHYPGKHKYWRVSQNKEDLGAKELYEPRMAFEKIGSHAEHFVNMIKGVLRNYKEQTGQVGTMISMYDTELYGHWWFEGPEWLYEVLKRVAGDPEIKLITGSEQVSTHPSHEIVHLPEGSWGEGGYHWVWLNEMNSWTWEQIYPAERRLTALVNQYGSDEKATPILKQAARELLLAESSDWQFLITTWSARDYAEIRIAEHLHNFTALADLAEKVAQGGTPSEEELSLLRDCEQRDSPFQDLELSWWAKVEHPAEASV